MRSNTANTANEAARFRRIASGFTLVEIILAVALIAIIGGVTVGVSQRVLVQNDQLAAENAVIADLRAARERSLGNADDSQWGVRIESGTITIFRGSSYASRDTQADVTTPISDTITVSGDQEYVFSQLTGAVDETGSVTITSASDRTQTLSVNQYGVANRQ